MAVGLKQDLTLILSTKKHQKKTKQTKKTFDRVNHEYLFMTMKALGFEGDFLELTKMLYNEITSQIIVNGQPTNKINIQRGVRQGCPFSMILFVLSTILLINMIKEEKRFMCYLKCWWQGCILFSLFAVFILHNIVTNLINNHNNRLHYWNYVGRHIKTVLII